MNQPSDFTFGDPSADVHASQTHSGSETTYRGTTSQDTLTPAGLVLIDHLSIQFNLNAGHKSYLRALFQLISSLEGNLSPADMLSRIYMLACQLGTEACILDAVQTLSRAGTNDNSSTVHDVQSILNELSICLDSTFQLTSEQTKIIRAKASHYRMDNIFGKPCREEKWMTNAKRIASSVRNAFCQDICNSVIGSNQVSLPKFTYDCAEKYRHGHGSMESIGEGYLARVAILRRFAVEHKTLLVVDEASESAEEDVGTPMKRKCTKGRTPSNLDFWGQVDSWFAKEIKERRKDFAGVAWKTYIDESITVDDSRYEEFLHSKRDADGNSHTTSGLSFIETQLSLDTAFGGDLPSPAVSYTPHSSSPVHMPTAEAPVSQAVPAHTPLNLPGLDEFMMQFRPINAAGTF
ncbi:hypothetical protein HYPSUDRAFT_53536 [Hypholoma sublateritium FD-334 SS-4]|uniref:Uncharacterized protein n=1 Tax=Hypholoma sublateritium (strain FD-334 SS-4) TaxID=945553 RepID=A0A0D2LC01_HYPSF|nr:hypothetical protein HYPSUDRAFT_53536 [Hypholoma sublateritium FD-334 SS-4]